jgi:flagellar hook-associated protein 1 FlgK
MATGYGMDDIDLSAPPPARTFFTSSINSTINASTISVNADLINNPKDLPLSKFANQPGNADISREIARIAEDKTFLNNLNPIEYYAGFISRIGSVARDAINGLSTTKLVNEQLDTQRESVMGVNLDEEAVNLIKFQKGFEAASRIINMTNEILSTLINLGK